MQVDVIERLEQFEELRDDWNRVYARDPHAHIFVSWSWLRGWFEATPYQWIILALKTDGADSYAAFFPLAVETHRSKLLRLLHMGGNPMADYTGFVCDPDYEEEAIAGFAHHLQQEQNWDVFHLRDVLDPRLDQFLGSFSDENFAIEKVDRTPCPHIQLSSESYEAYLQDFVSAKTRSNVRYYTRKMEAVEGFRITHVNESNLEEQIETLLYLWKLRWGLEPYGQRPIFRRCFESDSLWIAIFWAGQEPITGLAGFVDQTRKTFSYFISGFDGKFTNLRPGRVMVAYSIRCAIESGFKMYDFLRGGEEYKYSFGAVDRFNSNIDVIPTNMRSRTAHAMVDLGKRLLRTDQPED